MISGLQINFKWKTWFIHAGNLFVKKKEHCTLLNFMNVSGAE
jgi:hypothetical protein